jgi:hypothetical protein
MNIQIT